MPTSPHRVRDVCAGTSDTPLAGRFLGTRRAMFSASLLASSGSTDGKKHDADAIAAVAEAVRATGRKGRGRLLWVATRRPGRCLQVRRAAVALGPRRGRAVA